MNNNNLALPPMPQQSNTIANAGIGDLDDLMQSDEFLQMINDDSLANVDLDTLFLPEQTADPNQMSSFSNIPLPKQMQPQMQLQMPTPPSMEPNTLMGPSYHPMVGWYFPALPSSGFSTPVAPFPTISDGYTPASSMPTSAMPSGASTPNPYLTPPKPKGRRKYGPAAFLEEQANTRLKNDLPLRDSPTKKQPVLEHPLRDGKNLSIVQACVCTDKETNKIKRPKNAFILYRSANSKKIIDRLGHSDNQAISKILGQAWRNESDQVVKKYKALAALEKERHEAMYPGYKYQPGQSSRNKFGSASCTCGAYEANLKALRAREGESEDEGSDVEEYVPSRRSRGASQAPTAPMTYQEPIPDPSTFGFPTPAQRAEAEAYVENLKRKRDAATVIEDDAEEPLAKRRSPRQGKNSVTYTEPVEDDIFQSGSADAAKPRPSQAALALDTSPTLSAAGFAGDSPARNTRNSMRAKTPSPQIPQTEFPFDFDDNMMQDTDWEALFESSGLLAEVQGDVDDEGDNIVVAERRPSSRGRPNSQGSPTMSTRSRQKSVEAEAPLRRSSRKVSK